MDYEIKLKKVIIKLKQYISIMIRNINLDMNFPEAPNSSSGYVSSCRTNLHRTLAAHVPEPAGDDKRATYTHPADHRGWSPIRRSTVPPAHDRSP